MDESGELAVLGYRNGKVHLLGDLPASLSRGGAQTVDYFGHRGVVTSLVVSPDRGLAASGASDGLVRIWDVETRSPSPFLLRHPAGPINALAFSSDGRWLVSAGPGSARVHELATGSLVNEIEVEGDATAVAFAPDGRIVAVGDAAGNIILASPDATQGVLTVRLRSPVTSLRFGETTSILASGTSDGNLVFWDTLEARATEAAISFAGPIAWIDFASADTEVYLRSGTWLHRLDRTQNETIVTASSLLPSHLRSSPALAVTERAGLAIRALASAGGGRLVLADVAVGATGADAGVGLAMVRDWESVLALEIDPATGVVQPIAP
jgi:hypothetical protein